MGRILRIYETFNRYIAFIGYCLPLATMFLVVFDVLGRNTIGQPVPATIEINSMVLVFMASLGLTYTHINNGHVTITLLWDQLPGYWKSWIGILNNMLCLFLFALMSVRSAGSSIRSFQDREVWASYDIPIYPAKFVFTLGSALLSVYILLRIILAVQKIMESSEGADI